MGSILISGFPGIGKSYLVNNLPEGVCSDSDSSQFNKKDFPHNYIKHIKSLMGKVDIILISSHEEVRKALVSNKMEFILVYPKRELKGDYLNRYKERGSPEAFINLLDNKWDEWMDELESQKGCRHVVLNKGQFLKDVIRKRK